MSGAGAHVVRAHRTAAAAVPEDQPLHLEPAHRELRAQPELLEEAGAVGRERHRGAHLPQLRGLLVDVGGDAVPAQRDGQGQTTDTRAHNGNTPVVGGTHVEAH